MKHPLHHSLRLCFLSSLEERASFDIIVKAVQGGATMVQLRAKNAERKNIQEKAIALKKILQPLGVPLIINDFVDLALEIDADGVHLGQQDMSPVQARRILGPNKIIGFSIESMEELYQANQLKDISYVTASALFPSRTKPDCKKLWGLQGLEEIARHSYHPVTAIGGITEHNIGDILKIKNVSGVAVIGALQRACCPYNAAKNLIGHFNKDKELHYKRLR